MGLEDVELCCGGWREGEVSFSASPCVGCGVVKGSHRPTGQSLTHSHFLGLYYPVYFYSYTYVQKIMFWLARLVAGRAGARAGTGDVYKDG